VKELTNVYQEKGFDFLDDLFNDYLVVTEKLAGSSFSFQKKNNSLEFFKGDSRKPINLIDRTLMVYYEKPIKFISEIPPVILSQIPDNWRFCFQYFVHNKPSTIEYEKLPHNSLVLTHIIVKDERGKTAKIIEDPRVIRDWATKFHVTPMQPIFKGKLNSEQKEKIKDFISVPIEDQMEIFGTTSFAEYLIKGVLNPSLSSTLLHNNLKNPIDSIIFKFYGKDGQNTVSAKMIDPYTTYLMKDKEPVDIRRTPADLNEIVLLDLLAFLEERGLKRHDVLSATTEERYLELISAIFNDYVEKRGDDLQKLDFQKANFIKGDEFNLNTDLIRNEKTKQILSQSDVLKDLFKIILGSLRKKRNPEKEGPIMTSSVIEDFNKMVDKIRQITQQETDGEFKTFDDYLKLKEMNEELYVGNDLQEMITEEVYLNFKEFANISKVNLNEALKVPHKNQGKKKVNIFVGRFQPFTLGHAKVFKQLHDLNGLPVHVLMVRGGKPDPEKRPFDEDAQQRMFQAMQKEYPFLSGSSVIPNGAIDTIFADLRPAYEPVIWGFGTDRKKAYGGMIDKPEYRAQLGVLPEFKGYEIKRGDEDISASKVRKALKIDDRKTFEKMVPKSLHDFYEELQNILVPIEESVINESKLTKKQQYWITGFEKYSKTTDWIKPKSKVKGEVLRANFGMNDGTAEKNIKDYLKVALGINPKNYSIEQISSGSYVPNAGGKISSDYDSYGITIVNPTKDKYGDTYIKGDVFFITNRLKTVKGTGTAAVIGRKDLTPDAMGLPISEYKDPSLLFAKVQSYIEKLSYPDNYKNFILESTREVMSNTSNANSYSTFEKYANAKSDYLFYDISEELFDGIDPISIKNFQNDYGEVLGGFMLFNLLKDDGAGLRYPTASNEKLVDFFFDDYSISSKAGSGGTPSGDTIIQKINTMHKDGHLHFDTINEQDFYNNVIKQWVNPPKLDKSNTYNNILNLCNVNIPSNPNDSGYWYILSKANLQPKNATRDNIVSYLDNLSNDENEFKSVMSAFYDKAGVNVSRLSPDRVYESYIKQKNANDKNRIGFIFYGLMVESTQTLNERYQEQLTKYGQIVTDVKQLYLDVLVKKGTFRFKTVPFKTATFKFEQKGSIPNPFNANMGIKILK
jgi:hypothetical protein